MASKVAQYTQKYVVQPVVNTATKIEARSAAKLTKATPAVATSISQHNANGTDAAAASTQRFVAEQRQLLSYRVVRGFEEARYVFSGQYFKKYNTGCLLQDLRWMTQMLFFFIIAVICGRQSIFPPIAPDSQLALALNHKPNPNY